MRRTSPPAPLLRGEGSSPFPHREGGRGVRSRAHGAAVGQAGLRPLLDLVRARDTWLPASRRRRCPGRARRWGTCSRRAPPAAGEHLVDQLGEAAPFLDAEVGRPRSRCRLAAWPTGETSPGPCQAVRTPNALRRMASLRAGVMPPIWLMCTRMKSIRRSGDQRLPLARVVEQLAHGDGRGALLADAWQTSRCLPAPARPPGRRAGSGSTSLASCTASMGAGARGRRAAARPRRRARRARARTARACCACSAAGHSRRRPVRRRAWRASRAFAAVAAQLAADVAIALLHEPADVVHRPPAGRGRRRGRRRRRPRGTCRPSSW